MIKEEINPEKAMKAQKEYCEKNHLPYFAPSRGVCFSCGQNIYTKIGVWTAGHELITGCPHCCRSFCD